MFSNYNTSRMIEQSLFDGISPAPDADGIQQHYRQCAPSAWIAFYRKARGMLRPLGALQVSALMQRGIPPQIKTIESDLYMSVNTFKYPAPDGPANLQNGMQRPIRRNATALELNAVFVDLDVGRPGQMHAIDALCKVLHLEADGAMPRFSQVCFSGRGLYLLYFLMDGEACPPATEANKARYKRISAALLERMPPELCPDASATDPARIMRAPGSFNSKADDRQVRYSFQSQGPDGKPLRHTLEALESFLNIQSPAYLRLLPDAPSAPGPGFRPIAQRGSAPARRKGYEATNRKRAEAIEAMEAARGGLPHGGTKHADGWRSPGRYLLLALYAQYLNASGCPGPEVIARVKAMAARCQPPYPSDRNDPPLKRIFDAIKYGDADQYFKNMPLARFHELIGASFLPPDTLPTAPSAPAQPTEAARIAARRDAVKRIIQQADIRPTPAAIASLTAAQGIVQASGKPYGIRTIKADLAYLKKQK